MLHDIRGCICTIIYIVIHYLTSWSDFGGVYIELFFNDLPPRLVTILSPS